MGNSTNSHILILSAIVLHLLFQSCNKFENLPPSGGGPTPAQVSNISVTNLNGEALIQYTIPANPDFAYVRADYETSPGVMASIKSSAFSRQILVPGFADTLQHTVKLYSVSQYEVSSAPVEVTVEPLTPQYILAARSIRIAPAFGGINVRADNGSRSNLVFTPLLDTGSNTTLVMLDKIYTADSIVNFNIRSDGSKRLDTIPYTISIVVSDRWLHTSDTITAIVKPLYEMLLDKNKMTYINLPGDASWFSGSGFHLWLTDDIRKGWVFGLTLASVAPQPVTWALDDQMNAYKLNRILIYPYNEPSGGYYSSHAPKVFEIWGTNDPAADGSFDNWDKLGHFEVTKPSGLPYGQQNSDDVNYAYNGWEFGLANQDRSYKYLRLLNLQTWNNGTEVGFSSFQLYGVKQ